jgi:hypothetical protein
MAHGSCPAIGQFTGNLGLGIPASSQQSAEDLGDSLRLRRTSSVVLNEPSYSLQLDPFLFLVA